MCVCVCVQSSPAILCVFVYYLQKVTSILVRLHSFSAEAVIVHYGCFEYVTESNTSYKFTNSGDDILKKFTFGCSYSLLLLNLRSIKLYSPFTKYINLLKACFLWTISSFN